VTQGEADNAQNPRKILSKIVQEAALFDGDGWIEGGFEVDREGCDVQLQLYDTEGGHWKRGLTVEYVRIVPSECRDKIVGVSERIVGVSESTDTGVLERVLSFFR